MPPRICAIIYGAIWGNGTFPLPVAEKGKVPFPKPRLWRAVAQQARERHSRQGGLAPYDRLGVGRHPQMPPGNLCNNPRSGQRILAAALSQLRVYVVLYTTSSVTARAWGAP